MHNHNMLEVNNLSKNFAGTGRETEFAAVDGISFTLDAGECLGLIGESGCGKSTTARLITGLVQADAGSVLLEGEEILGRKGRRQREVYRKIQMVFQTPQDSFDPMQTLETGILEAFRNQGMSRKEACLHLPELLKKVELSSETAMRYPRETSGGECQRAAIARALAVQPSLLICDEATSALDAAVQAQIVQLLEKTAAGRRTCDAVDRPRPCAGAGTLQPCDCHAAGKNRGARGDAGGIGVPERGIYETVDGV